MKIMYVESVQKNLNIELSKTEIKKLPKKLFLAYSIQYKELAEDIKKQLTKNKIKVEKFQQVLGCSKIKTNLPVLLVSTGKFHAQNLYLQTPILYSLENNKIIKISCHPLVKLRYRHPVFSCYAFNYSVMFINIQTLFLACCFIWHCCK